MPQVTIVAIPEQDDRVWKVSSQKVPHMTMLFLGEINNEETLAHIRSYLEHVVRGMHRFGMMVDRRGELEAPGRDTADVLFFDMEHMDWLENTRNFMLQDDSIRTAYDSAPQFPNWIPHLTLGYPDNPANDDAVDFGIHWVEFDRLAMWTEEFDGPDWVLPKLHGMAESWSDKAMRILAHHGVKGMRWGVRKRASGGKPATTGTKRTKFKKSPSRLSDKEINRRIKRLELEKQYNKLNASDKSKGRQFVEGVLESSGRTVAKTVVTGAATIAIKSVLDKSGGTLAKDLAKRLG